MLTPPFAGFGPGLPDFFRGLAADNSKAFFDSHRAVYEEQVRTPLSRLLEEAAERFGGSVKLFRQNRDTRFSADKSPYKTNTYGMVHGIAGRQPLYASVSAEGIYAGTGEYQMQKDQLDRFRAAIDDGDSGPDLVHALDVATAAGLDRWGEEMKTVPRGFAPDHPRAALLRIKGLVVGAQLGPAETLDGRRPLDHCLRVWDAAGPLSDWLVAHVGPSMLAPGRR
jgi:uncharacterized protein (TIGR02453 family)